jgi:hypothetical protein
LLEWLNLAEDAAKAYWLMEVHPLLIWHLFRLPQL